MDIDVEQDYGKHEMKVLIRLAKIVRKVVTIVCVMFGTIGTFVFIAPRLISLAFSGFSYFNTGSAIMPISSFTFVSIIALSFLNSMIVLAKAFSDGSTED